ncbi:hypothetical protein MRX96_058585 [Rhipicephalus microplus]
MAASQVLRRGPAVRQQTGVRYTLAARNGRTFICLPALRRAHSVVCGAAGVAVADRRKRASDPGHGGGCDPGEPSGLAATSRAVHDHRLCAHTGRPECGSLSSSAAHVCPARRARVTGHGALPANGHGPRSPRIAFPVSRMQTATSAFPLDTSTDLLSVHCDL